MILFAALIIATIASPLATAAPVSNLPAVCQTNAAKFAEKLAEKKHYDKNGFFTVGCELASNNQAVLCQVGAHKGNFAAEDTYLVVLDRSCTRAYRVELTGEE